MKKVLLCTAVLFGLFAAQAMADNAKEPIKIGDIAAYTKGALFAEPYNHGVKMAVDEINKAGGVLGRPLVVLSRDSKADPGEAVRIAQELQTRDNVNVLINADFSGTTLAVSSWAKQNHVPMVVCASEADSIIWKQRNDYLARVDYSGYAWVSGSIRKAIDLYGDRLKNKRWVVIAPNIEFGHSFLQSAKDIAAAHGLNANWVGEQWPAYDKLDAGATLVALEQDKPDVVFTVLWGDDLAKFVREAKKRDFTKNRIIIAPAIGLPEYFDMLGAETPKGWVTVGFPFDEIKTPSFVDFANRYEIAYHAPLKTYSVIGYDGIQAIAAAIRKAGSTDPEKIRQAFDGLHYPTPFGEQSLRAIDHQTTLPFWVGLSDVVDGKPKLSNWTEYNVGDNLPSDDGIRAKGQQSKENK
ncbi:MAG: ABC transporter substrate-binding protein [Alphaproteobacteria bacterium]|nr:ABC transporter substrate-binding protein [Alphaproteobacteria bacterium]